MTHEGRTGIAPAEPVDARFWRGLFYAMIAAGTLYIAALLIYASSTA